MKLKKIIIGGIGAIAIGGVLIFGGTEQLKWVGGYETLLFDTPSGDMEVGYYSDTEESTEYYVRLDATYQRNFDSVDKTFDVSKLKKAKVIGKAYYNEFLKKDGTIVRERTTSKAYWDVAQKKDYPQPSKTIAAPLFSGTKAEAAIAFDAATASTNSSNVSSKTFSHTSTGSKLFMILAVECSDNDSGEYNATTVTYNSVALTWQTEVERSSTNNHIEMWWLVAPSTGANTVSISDGSGFSCDDLSGSVMTFTGVDQTNAIDTSNTGFCDSSCADPSTTITTGVANTWVADIAQASACFGSGTVGANQTQRYTASTGNGNLRKGSTEPAASIATYTMSWDFTCAGTLRWVQILLSFNQAAAAGAGECVLNPTGDSWIASECYISANTTTQGIIHLIDGADVHCINASIIEAEGLTGDTGSSFTSKQACKLEFWRPN